MDNTHNSDEELIKLSQFSTLSINSTIQLALQTLQKNTNTGK